MTVKTCGVLPLPCECHKPLSRSQGSSKEFAQVCSIDAIDLNGVSRSMLEGYIDTFLSGEDSLDRNTTMHRNHGTKL